MTVVPHEKIIVARDAPEPLRRPVPPPEPYPVEALGEVLSGAARALNRVVRSPMALCGQSVLAAASLAAQRLADVEIDGRRHPLSLWLQTIAESGERKSATDGPSLAAHRTVEQAGFDRYHKERLAHEADARAHALAVKSIEGKASKLTPAELKRQLLALGPPPPPLLPHLVCAEPTLEGLHKLLMYGTGALGLFSDEGAQFFGGFAMGKEHAAKTAGGLSGLWDRGEADRVRSGDGAHKLYGKRLSMHLMMQPVIAERVLSDPLLQGQGFLARCLIAWPDGTAGSRAYVAESLNADPAMAGYWKRMEKCLTAIPSLREGSRNELDPPVLRLTADAKAIWIRAHDAVECRMAPEGEYSTIRPWASKAAEQILRVAGVLSVIADTEARTIETASIEAGATLVDWYLSEVLRLVGVAELPPDIRAAESVLRWCRERGLRRVHSSLLVKDGPACVRVADRLHEAMRALERHGWAVPLDPGEIIDGRPRRHVWRLILED